MKKDNEKETAKSKREAKKVASLQSLEGLAERDAKSLVIGMDLGDRASAYCVRTLGQEIILEGTVATKVEAILDAFKNLRRQRVVIETGTHSRWIAQLIEAMGHEVIVGERAEVEAPSDPRPPFPRPRLYGALIRGKGGKKARSPKLCGASRWSAPKSGSKLESGEVYLTSTGLLMEDAEKGLAGGRAR